MIAANEPFTGDMGGVAGADHICYKEAKAARMPGTFRAFLTSRVQNLDSVIPRKDDRIVPIVNLRVCGEFHMSDIL